MKNQHARMLLTALELQEEASRDLRGRIVEEITAKTPEELDKVLDLSYTDNVISALDEALEIVCAARNAYCEERDLTVQDAGIDWMHNDRTREEAEP